MEERKCILCAHGEWAVPEGCDPKTVRWIPLTKGCFALVDAGDYRNLSRHTWHAMGRDGAYYAARCKNKKTILMHREIMRLSRGQKGADGKALVVDHIDRNPLNNTRANLRLCTQQQNMCNRPLPPKTSRYRGVYWNARSRKWHASLQHDGRTFHIGYFLSETDAARAFDTKAKELRGEFACLNFEEEE
ncbi:MAG: HNH endonuclease [Sedimentisphaerales bacterium]|nr:HNH endonuclease [Sedimentisphaerales bacterium]